MLFLGFVYGSEDCFEQFHRLWMGESEIFLKGSLNSSLYEIKQIILVPETKVLETVYEALPKGISLKQRQIFFHQLHLFVALHEDQVPKVKQTHFLVSFFSPLAFGLPIERVQQFSRSSFAILFPGPLAERALTTHSKFLLHVGTALLGLRVQKINSESFSLFDVPHCEESESSFDMYVGAVGHAFLFEAIEFLPDA
jgi:hypothetical protein